MTQPLPALMTIQADDALPRRVHIPSRFLDPEDTEGQCVINGAKLREYGYGMVLDLRGATAGPIQFARTEQMEPWVDVLQDEVNSRLVL